MAEANFHAQFSRGEHTILIGVSLYVWEEEGVHYIYSPSLDVTGYGDNFNEAKKSFEITLDEFVTYTHNKKTIFDELEHLGWTVNRKKKRVHAPNMEELLEDNDSLKDIISKEGVKRINKNIELELA